MTHCLVNYHITCHLVFVLVCTEWVMMCPAIDNTVSCEIRAIICFFHVKNMSAAEIHCELCTVVYGQNVMSEGTVRQWCSEFKDGQANKCSWWTAKWLAICSEWWSCSKCWPKNLLKTALYNFTHCSIPDFTVSLGYHKFCTRRVLKMLRAVHKMQRMALALTLTF
jgi:hypothetical protein